MRFEEILVFVTIFTGLMALIDLVFPRVKRGFMFREEVGIIGKVYDSVVVNSKSFFPVLLIVLIFRSFAFEGFRIPTGSMKPGLLEGDVIVVNKYKYGVKLPILRKTLMQVSAPKRGDIIVFHHTKDKDLIKRVVGLPGDTVKYADDKLYINGKLIETAFQGKEYDIDIKGHPMRFKKYIETTTHPYNIYVSAYKRRIEPQYQYGDVIVPEGHYFVLGDNRSNSEDGRYWGFVPEKNILGKAIATVVSIDWYYKILRKDRCFKWIS